MLSTYIVLMFFNKIKKEKMILINLITNKLMYVRICMCLQLNYRHVSY